jgi:hypothetical protein
MKNNLVQKIVRDAVESYATVSKLALAGSIVGFGFIEVNPAQAASLNNGTGLSNPATIIDFSDIPWMGALGLTFSGLQVNFPATTPNGPNEFKIADVPFLIRFAQPQSQAAFSLVTQPGTSTFEALLFGNSTFFSRVDRFSIETDRVSTNNFYGFTGVTFDAIRVFPGGPDGTALIDNLQFGTATVQSVPEPLTVIGTIIGGTAAMRMRKKLKSTGEE